MAVLIKLSISLQCVIIVACGELQTLPSAMEKRREFMYTCILIALIKQLAEVFISDYQYQYNEKFGSVRSCMGDREGHFSTKNGKY